MLGPNCPRGAKFFNNNVEMIVKENVSSKHVKMAKVDMSMIADKSTTKVDTIDKDKTRKEVVVIRNDKSTKKTQYDNYWQVK
jgi:hypothetical protein